MTPTAEREPDQQMTMEDVRIYIEWGNRIAEEQRQQPARKGA